MNLMPYLQKGYSYENYLEKIKNQFKELEKAKEKSDYANYYSMNLKRMERLEKTFALSSEQKEIVKTINTDFKLLVISEGWCGDAAQSMPIVNQIVNELDIEQRIVFRDENPELMDKYLTDGAKSIPIYIGVNKDGSEVFRFGPRPKEGMEMLAKHKANPDAYTADEFHKDLQIWYNQNKGESIVSEFVRTVNSL